MRTDGDMPNGEWSAATWPDDGVDPAWPDPGRVNTGWPELPLAGLASRDGRPRGLRVAALALTAAVALGAGAGAALVYERAVAPAGSPAAASSPGRTAGPGQGGGTVTAVLILGRVLAVSRGRLTVGGGPAPAISAQVTSATRFTGSARSLAEVRVGDSVTAQITESGSRAVVISLQDPLGLS